MILGRRWCEVSGKLVVSFLGWERSRIPLAIGCFLSNVHKFLKPQNGVEGPLRTFGLEIKGFWAKKPEALERPERKRKDSRHRGSQMLAQSHEILTE